MKSSVVVLVVMLSFLVPYSGHAQGRKRVAVLGFDESAVQQPTYNVGQRITDQLISVLAGNTSFEVIDRKYLEQITHEQTQSYGNRFDAAGAIKLGKLANANVLIIGQVDTLSTHKVKQDGVVDLRVTVRLIQVETGEILGAPSVNSEQKVALAESSNHSSGKHMGWALPLAQVLAPAQAQAYVQAQAQAQSMAEAQAIYNAQRYGSHPSSPAENTAGIPDGDMQKLVDEAVYDASSQLAIKINAMMPSTSVLPAAPKFVGIEEGLVVLNKGHNSGLKVGDKFEVIRVVESSLIDPDTHQPITHKTKKCVLTLSVVEDGNASGKCDGPNVPQSGDLFTLIPSTEVIHANHQ